MKEGWEYKRLEEICTPINGLWKGKKEPFVNVGVIRNANFKKDFTLDFSNIEYLDVEAKKFASRKLEPGDLIVERSGGSEKQPVGRAVLFNQSEGDYSFSNFTSVIRINDRKQVSPIFLFKYLLYFYLKGETRPMQNAAIGLHNLDFKRYLSIEVPVPPLSEQKRIVSYLDSTFAKIDALAKNAEASLNEAKALFQSALSTMMEPKEGWEEKHLDELAENLDNKRIPVKLDKRKEGQYPYYGASGIVDYVEDYIFDGNYLLVSEDGANLFARTTPIAFSVSGKFWVNNHAHILKFDNGFTQQFVEYYFKSINIKEYITGAAQPKLTQRNLNKIPIYIPSIKEQQLVVGDLKKLENIIQQLQSNLTHTLAECAALKQALLRQTFE